MAPAVRPGTGWDSTLRSPFDLRREIDAGPTLTPECAIDLAPVRLDGDGEVPRGDLVFGEEGGEGRGASTHAWAFCRRQTTKSSGPSPGDDAPYGIVPTMPAHEIDRKTRLRIAANLRELKHRFGFRSDAAMGRKIGLGRDAVNRALKGEKTVGLDFVLADHRKLHVSLDWLVENEADEKWYREGVE